jgi:hypothetical protein
MSHEYYRLAKGCAHDIPPKTAAYEKSEVRMNGDCALVPAACPVLDLEIPAARFRLMAADENNIRVTLRITV